MTTTYPPLRFSVCVETIFTNMPFEQRLEHVYDQGFAAFEFWGRDGKDMNITMALRQALRLEVSAFLGSKEPLVDAAQRPAFLKDIARNSAIAADLACERLIVLAGTALPGVSREEQRASVVAGLREAAVLAADADVTLLLEPLNATDHPGSFLTSSDEGFAIVKEVDSPNVRLLFDVYHQQISEGNLSQRITQNLDLIGHFHIADVPGRHEPGTGEINYDHLFWLLREQGYKGYVGLEYIPQHDAVVSLRHVRAMSR